jgi:hypothetical protein
MSIELICGIIILIAVVWMALKFVEPECRERVAMHNREREIEREGLAFERGRMRGREYYNNQRRYGGNVI